VTSLSFTVPDGPSVSFRSVGVAGPPGPGGLSNADSATLYADPALTPPATSILSGQRVVRSFGDHIDYANPGDGPHVKLWLTSGAISIGAVQLGDLITSGAVQSDVWSWTEGSPIYLGADGVLTQSTLDLIVVRVIAWPIDSQTISFDPVPGITTLGV
jgi:hypothetical protein